MKTKCISVVVDGVVLKVDRLLQEKYMPNMMIVCRDASYAIRIACKEPLVRIGGFKKQHEELFTNKGALLTSIDYSNLKKRACSRLVLDTERGGLTNIMADLSSAQQRWESMSAPYRIYCCILKASGMLLGAMHDWEKD